MTDYKLEDFQAWQQVNNKQIYADSSFIEAIFSGGVESYATERVQGNMNASEAVLLFFLEKKMNELATERETAQQALTTAQEWHERQKAEWKEKLQNLIQKWKTSLHQEITLIKEILSHDQ